MNAENQQKLKEVIRSNPSVDEFLDGVLDASPDFLRVFAKRCLQLALENQKRLEEETPRPGPTDIGEAVAQARDDAMRSGQWP